jgi:RNA polymerase sigma factor (TIGR02999 family)
VTSHRARATRILTAHASGKRRAAPELLPLVYDELRALAARYLRQERPGHTLQPTALVHEAYLRLVDCDRIDWKGRTHFFAMAAIQMRRILVEHARAAAAEKRGGVGRRVTFDEHLAQAPELSLEFLALDEALGRLAQRHERQGRIAELRLFGGMLVREIAFCVGVSERTVKEDWRVARAWLLKELSHGGVTA